MCPDMGRTSRVLHSHYRTTTEVESDDCPDSEEARETGELIEVEANEVKQATIHAKIGEKAEQDGPE